MKKRNKVILKAKCNWRGIGTLMVITVCLASVMMPAMTQSSLSLFNNASNASDGETGETPSPTPVPSPTPTQSPSPSPSPAPTPIPTSSPTPTPGPTPTLTPTPSPTPSPATPDITSFAPSSPVYDTEGATRTFNITINQIVNVTWRINGSLVQINTSVKTASYTNTSAATGIRNVSAIISNEDGTVRRTWIWNVLPQETPIPTPTPTPGPSPRPSPLTTPTPTHISASNVTSSPSTPFYIYGWVYYGDGNESYRSTVNITNINTSEIWQAETSVDSNYFQRVVKNISKDDMLAFNVTDGTQFNTTNYSVNITKGGIFGINLTLETSPETDLVVTDLWSDPGNPLFGDIVNVTARIENKGTVTNSTAVFYDDKNVSIFKSYNISNSTDTWNDTISQSGALQIRLHFVDIHILGNGSYIKIYNASDNLDLIHNFTVHTNPWNITDFWTNWSIGERIRIESHVTNHLNFTIDKYESVFANEPVTLGCGQSKNFTAEWNASAWLNDSVDIASGNHTICVNVTPVMNESNTENNHKSIVVAVKPLIDLELTNVNVSLDKTPLLDGDLVNVTATVMNNGSRDATYFKVVFLDNALGEDEGSTSLNGVVFNETIISRLSAGNSTDVSTTWNASSGYHTITAIVDPANSIRESNETNNQNSVSVCVNKSRDFTVTNLAFNLTEPVIGDVVKINATIANFGIKEGTTTVEFYDTKSIELKRTEDDYSGWEEAINDNLTLPEALKIRVHFSYIGAFSYITIYDKNNSVVEIFNFPYDVSDNWTEWASGDTIRIESEWANFSVDRYEAVLANKSISLEPGNFTDLPPIHWNLSLQEFGWATNGTHNITVKVDPYNHTVEFNETNNTQMKSVLVNASLDFAVTDLTFNLTEPVIGDVVKINATIANLGIKEGTTTVEFYDNEALLANMSISLEPGNFTNRSVDWNLSLQASGWTFIGEHNITVKVDPCNRIEELNETNNTKTRMVVVNASLDFTVINISFNTTQPLLNHTVMLNATVANPGKRNGTATLRAYCDEIIVNETELSLNFTDPPRIVNMRWIANITNGGAGPHNISVGIDPDNAFAELNETNNTQIEQIFVNGTDLAVTNMVIPCGDLFEGEDFCHCGQNVNITATIVNLGAINATNFNVIFRDRFGKGDISDDISPFNSTNIASLVAGNSTNITVLWVPPAGEFGIYTITASIPFDRSDNNETNNKLSKFVAVESEYDFSVKDVNVTPREVREGEPVNITATIGNLGFESENVSVGFYVNSTDFVGSKDERFIRINTTEVYVEAGKTSNTSITWNANIAGGEHMIVAVADPDNERAEPDGKETKKIGDSLIFKGNETGNNVKNCMLHVISPQLNITNLTLDPAQPLVGDEVNVTAEIKNEGNELAKSMVWFYMEQDVSIPFSKSEAGIGYTGKWCPSWSVPLPENKSIRVHLDYIAIRKYASRSKTGTDDVIYAYVDGQPVSFYVKSKDVADGQPIKVPWIKFNTSCHKCMDPGQCNHKRWEDVWTEWSEGNTIKVHVIAFTPYNLSLLIDKYQVRLGNRTVTIDAHNSSSYNVTWNASSPLKPENYTIKVVVEEHNETHSVDLGGTDLAVTDVSVIKNLSVVNEVWDGDQVVINATIENLGRKNATNFFVNFSEIYMPIREITIGRENYDSTKLINVTHIAGLEIGNSTNISFVLWNASIRDIVCNGKCLGKGGVPEGCEWNEAATDNYTIKVEINPLDNPEEDKINDSEEVRVHVKRSRDFSVTNLSFVVNNKTRNPSELVLYDLVTLNATLNITNHANRGGIVNVSFYVDEIATEHEIGNDSIRFETFDKSNGTAYAEIKWKIENLEEVYIPGDHNITVIADPENEIYEINESNNASTWQIHVKASDLTVTNLSFNTERPERGEKVQINVTIANYGKENATNVTLAIYDWADRHIDNVATLWNYSGFLWIEVKRKNATAMRLYLDLDIKGGEVCIYDSKGEQIKPPYSESFHGWTPWVLGNNITVVTKRNETSRAYAKVSKVYYLEQSKPFNTTTHDLMINENKTTTVNWTASTDCLGERLIAAIIDPGKNITEYDESNNTKAEYISVLTKDLDVSNLSLRWSNGTLINDTVKIKDGDNVTIVANVTNIGIEEADNFSVYFLVDDVLIPEGEKIIPNLAPNKSTPVVANWTANVSSHVLKVEADYENVIDETNETNNIVAKERYICGAEVSGNESWETFGLHAEILFDNKTQPYDEDEVNITVNITNYGCLKASDFNVLLFYDYTPKPYVGLIVSKEVKETYHGAEWVYLRIIDGVSKDDIPPGYEWKWNPMDAGDVEVYDAWGNAVLNKTNFNDTCRWAEVSEGMSCWIPVRGNTTNVTIIAERNEDFIVYFYPVYENETSRLFEGISVPVNGSSNVSMNLTMSEGKFTIMAVIDPENRVPEDNKKDNIVTKIMHVEPTRDFTVTEVEVIPERTNISDGDTLSITANVSNAGFRNGTTKIEFIDYENETRIYNYYFDKNRSLSYLPISPDTYVSSYRKLTIIHRPRVDAIQLHFAEIMLDPYASPIPVGRIWVCNEVCDDDEDEEVLWKEKYDEDRAKGGTDVLENVNLWIPGDIVYIYTKGRASFRLNGYTTRKELPCDDCEDVTLNASVTWDESGNITARRSKPKDITAPQWNASTGDHNITVTIDPDDEISERNETNNTFILPLSVKAAKDLAIVELNVTPLHPDHGNDVNITVVVQNKGNKTVNSTIDLWADTTRNYRADSGFVPGASWVSMQEDRIRYIRLLKHTNVSLGPGENEPVTAIWENMSVYGDPTHIVTVIADPLDEIDEINESNNEMSPEIVMNYPDLTVVGFNSPTPEDNASVTIENIGARGASDVTVRFYKIISEDCLKRNSGTPMISITKDGAGKMRIHFSELDAEDGTLEIKKHPDLYETPEDDYSGQTRTDVWTRWIEGNTTWIIYSGATFEIDKYEWGDVEDIIIDLEVSESKNVSFPARWNEYMEPQWLNVMVDPDNVIKELKEGNNNGTARLYIDLVLKGIDIVGNQLKATVWSDNTLEDGIAFPPPCNFEVSCKPLFAPRTINKSFYGGDIEEVWFDLAEVDFKPNVKRTLSVKADYSKDRENGVIEEIDETKESNEDSVEIGPDITIEGIKFLNEKENKVDTDKLIVGEPHFIEVKVKNMKGKVGDDKIAFVAAKEFYVVVNMTNETLSPKFISYLSPGEPKTVKFSWTPSKKGWFDVTIKAEADPADPFDVVPEVNENNNSYVYSRKIKVGEPGYKAKDIPMSMFKDGKEEIHGGIIYTTGDTHRLPSVTDTLTLPTNFRDPVPATATSIRCARLYVYIDTAYYEDAQKHKMALLPDNTMLKVEFNGNEVSKTDPISLSPGINKPYTDIPDATHWNVSHATFCYNVNYIKGADNTAIATRIDYNPSSYKYGIAGMALLIVYEDANDPLIRYWIGEDNDLMMAKNLGFDTGFEYEECTRKVAFNGVSDYQLANATLLTVLSPYTTEGLYPDAEGISDALYFNPDYINKPKPSKRVNIPPISGGTTGHWKYVRTEESNIALTAEHGDEAEGWEYVDVRGNNWAAIQSRGSYMAVTNAILKVVYPPDLVPCLEKLPIEAAVGKTYDIPVAKNMGRSEARNFNVSFYVNGELEDEKHVDVVEGVEGENIADLYFQWRPLTIGSIVNITVVVDTDTNVDELINSQRNGETNNEATREIPVDLGGWDESRGGGNPRKETTGTGEGVSAIEGEGAWTKAGGGEATAGEKEGEAVTGYLMKGSVAQGEAGGGGRSEEFSMLGLLLRIATLAAAVSLVFAGYLLERRRQNNKLSLEKKV